MCTYLTAKTEIEGSGKGPQGEWIPLTHAMVYVDHPHHAQFAHTVNIDFMNPGMGPAARIPVELTEEAALSLIEALREAIAAAPPGLASAQQQAPGASWPGRR
jgi:hypothetical protein